MEKLKKEKFEFEIVDCVNSYVEYKMCFDEKVLKSKVQNFASLCQMKLKRRPRLQKLWQQIKKNKKIVNLPEDILEDDLVLQKRELLKKTELNVKTTLERLGQLMSYLKKC